MSSYIVVFDTETKTIIRKLKIGKTELKTDMTARSRQAREAFPEKRYRIDLFIEAKGQKSTNAPR